MAKKKAAKQSIVNDALEEAFHDIVKRLYTTYHLKKNDDGVEDAARRFTRGLRQAKESLQETLELSKDA